MARLLVRKFDSHFLSYSYSNLSICFSTQIQQKEEEEEDAPFIAEYLMSSFGFSKDRALKVATNKNLAPIKTPERPESVIGFLKDTGLNDAQIKSVVSWSPQLLSYSVSKTLEPWARVVIAAGFTRETLIQLFRSNPRASAYYESLARLQFWRNFVGNSDEALLKLIKGKQLLDLDIDKRIIPQINLLREHGLSDKQIEAALVKTKHLLLQSPDSMKFIFEQTERLGFPRGSKMFIEGLAAFSCIKKDVFDTRVAFFKTTYGWSQEDINLALKKFPILVNLTQENVSSTMDFLVKKVGLNPRSIALWPSLLGRSLEKRLIPRHYVLTVLKPKGLNITRSFFSVCLMSEKRFIEKYILPYKEEVPDLAEAYGAACARKTPLS